MRMFMVHRDTRKVAVLDLLMENALELFCVQSDKKSLCYIITLKLKYNHELKENHQRIKYRIKPMDRLSYSAT